MNPKILDLLAAGSLKADQAAPYFASARASMPIVECRDIPVMAVDKHWRLYINPDTITKLSPDEIGFVLLHELAHLLRDHAGRADELGIGPDTHKMWNIAADCEINWHTWPGLKFLDSGVLPKQFGWEDNLLAEDYYGKIRQDGDKGKPQPQQQQPGQPGDKGKPQPGGGSGSDGVERDWEQAEGEGDEPGLTPLEQASKRMEAAENLREHIAQGRGTAPGGWARWAGNVVKPVVPWGKQFRHAMCSGLSKCGLGQQTYRRVRQRGEMCLPRHHKRDPIIAIVCDTSGSMGSGEGSPMHRAISELIGICKHVGAVNVIWTDSDCHLQQNVRRVADLQATGGGGTDMRVGIKYANSLQNGKRPDLVVTVTDGITPWDMPTPKLPHIACIVGNAPGPKFGQTIHINN